MDTDLVAWAEGIMAQVAAEGLGADVLIKDWMFAMQVMKTYHTELASREVAAKKAVRQFLQKQARKKQSADCKAKKRAEDKDPSARREMARRRGHVAEENKALEIEDASSEEHKKILKMQRRIAEKNKAKKNKKKKDLAEQNKEKNKAKKNKMTIHHHHHHHHQNKKKKDR